MPLYQTPLVKGLAVFFGLGLVGFTMLLKAIGSKHTLGHDVAVATGLTVGLFVVLAVLMLGYAIYQIGKMEDEIDESLGYQ